MLAVTLVVGLLSALSALAAPSKEIIRRQSITSLSTAQISSFKPFTFFASAGYCDPSTTLTWSCGANCDANAGFQPIASGGDGVAVQFWYVGYDPAHDTVIVAHQGTNFSKILPGLVDIDFALTPINSDLFPGVSSDVEVHNGFGLEHASTAQKVLAAVKTGLSQHSTKSITTVGHSLGAALSLLDAVYLHTQIPDAQLTFFGYGLPRVGNDKFANHVDANIGSFTRITNQKDPVPIVPGQFLGFHHPSGEAHIDDDLSWKSCPGQDNGDDQCSIGDTPNILVADTDNHDGPYDGVHMGC